MSELISSLLCVVTRVQCFVFWWEDVCCLHVAQVSYIGKFLAEATHCSSFQLCSRKTHLCKEGSAAIGLLYEETGKTVGAGYIQFNSIQQTFYFVLSTGYIHV